MSLHEKQSVRLDQDVVVKGDAPMTMIDQLDNNSETSRVEHVKRPQSGNYVDYYHPEKLKVQDFAYLHHQHAQKIQSAYRIRID